MTDWSLSLKLALLILFAFMCLDFIGDIVDFIRSWRKQ
jgi:hypothetical protein